MRGAEWQVEKKALPGFRPCCDVFPAALSVFALNSE
jgi:hypothetical protein